MLVSAPWETAFARGAPNVARAKTLFKAGAQAYADNDFDAALHAFEAARAIVPDPALTFSIAPGRPCSTPIASPSTPSIPQIQALDAQLDDILDEGLENRFARHAMLAGIVSTGLATSSPFSPRRGSNQRL